MQFIGIKLKMFIQGSHTSFYVDPFTPKLSFVRMAVSFRKCTPSLNLIVQLQKHTRSRFTQLPHHTAQILIEI